MISTTHKINILLQWTELDYNTFQYEQGIAYLEYSLGCDMETIRLLSGCRMYWLWWMKRWADRDIEFLSLYSSVSPAQLLPLYKKLHNPELLCHRIRPHRMVWLVALNEKSLCK